MVRYLDVDRPHTRIWEIDFDSIDDRGRVNYFEIHSNTPLLTFKSTTLWQSLCPVVKNDSMRTQ